MTSSECVSGIVELKNKIKIKYYKHPLTDSFLFPAPRKAEGKDNVRGKVKSFAVL